MTKTLDGKRPHDLYRFKDASAFSAAFATAVGAPAGEIARRVAGTERVAGVVLGGSLPLGIGTSVSDIDLLVLTDPGEELALPATDPRGGVLHVGTFTSAGAGLVRAEAVLLRGGIEINCQILSLDAVRAAAAQLETGGVSQTPYEFGHLSRLRTGWILDGGEGLSGALAPLRDRGALDLHCATWYLVGAMQDLEDARAALTDAPPLATHMGRSAAERGALSWFSSRGFAYVGAKWLRALETSRSDTPLGRAAAAHPGREEIVGLLFPPVGDRNTAGRYIDAVAAHVAGIRRAIEADRTFAVAFAICPQL